MCPLTYPGLIFVRGQVTSRKSAPHKSHSLGHVIMKDRSLLQAAEITHMQLGLVGCGVWGVGCGVWGAGCGV